MTTIPLLADPAKAAIMGVCDQDPVAAALYRVDTPRGPIFLCGHHFLANEELFTARGYRWLGPRGYDPRSALELDEELDELDYESGY